MQEVEFEVETSTDVYLPLLCSHSRPFSGRSRESAEAVSDIVHLTPTSGASDRHSARSQNVHVSSDSTHENVAGHSHCMCVS